MCVIGDIWANSMPFIFASGSGNESWGVAILSGFAGAVIAQVMAFWYAAYRRRQEYRALLKGVVAECEYCIQVTDEIVSILAKRDGSFKRLHVDYFRGVREVSAKYSMSKELRSALAAVCADLELLNFQADCVFNGKEDARSFVGTINTITVDIKSYPEPRDISKNVLSAREGVLGSLNRLKGAALKELKEEEYYENFD